MLICICTAYNTNALKEDVRNGVKLKEIISEKKVGTQCKKCCSCLKEEYKNESQQYLEALQEILIIATDIMPEKIINNKLDHKKKNTI